MSSDITKITQAYDTEQKTREHIENAMAEALTKAQNTATSSMSVDPRNFGVNYANSSCETKWTSVWPPSNLAMSKQPEINTHQSHRPYEAYAPNKIIQASNTPVRAYEAHKPHKLI